MVADEDVKEPAAPIEEFADLMTSSDITSHLDNSLEIE